jgi:hypothetical protein
VFDVQWKTIAKDDGCWLSLDWVGHRAPGNLAETPVLHRYDLGSDLIEERISYELGGTGALSIESDGVRCHIEFPLHDYPSVLETDLPDS